jgi:hypothetical protein
VKDLFGFAVDYGYLELRLMAALGLEPVSASRERAGALTSRSVRGKERDMAPKFKIGDTVRSGCVAGPVTGHMEKPGGWEYGVRIANGELRIFPEESLTMAEYTVARYRAGDMIGFSRTVAGKSETIVGPVIGSACIEKAWVYTIRSGLDSKLYAVLETEAIGVHVIPLRGLRPQGATLDTKTNAAACFEAANKVLEDPEPKGLFGPAVNESIELRRGHRVRITDGVYSGMEARVKRVLASQYGRQRVMLCVKGEVFDYSSRSLEIVQSGLSIASISFAIGQEVHLKDPTFEQYLGLPTNSIGRVVTRIGTVPGYVAVEFPGGEAELEPGDLERVTEPNANGDVFPSGKNIPFKTGVTVRTSARAEAPCRACGKANDVGVQVCWCCGACPS